MKPAYKIWAKYCNRYLDGDWNACDLNQLASDLSRQQKKKLNNYIRYTRRYRRHSNWKEEHEKRKMLKLLQQGLLEPNRIDGFDDGFKIAKRPTNL